MEEFKSNSLFDYEPIDSTNIKPAYFKSEREFEQEANQICDTLKDISKES